MKLLYDHDGARVYHGDSRFMTAIPDESIQMVITSPPYWNARDYSTWPQYEDYLADMDRVWLECYRVLIDGGRIAVNVPQGYGRPGREGGYKSMEADTTIALQRCGFTMRAHYVWNKGNMGNQSSSTAWGSWMSASNPSTRDNHENIVVAHKGSPGREKGVSTITAEEFMDFTMSVWNLRPATGSWHPAPFPDELPVRLIKLYTYQDDTVLDPFFGSGTTIWEAVKLGRKAIGIEMHRAYIEQACGPMFLLDNREE